MTGAYADAVERKVEAAAERIRRGEQVNGWDRGPEFICEQAAQEPVDVAGWLRGLEQHEMPPRAEELIDVIVGDAALLFDAIRELGRLYER